MRPRRGGSLGATLHSQATLLIHRAQPCHHPLPRSSHGAIALHQGPVSMALAILLSIAAPQIHSSILRIYESDSRGLVVTTSAFRSGVSKPQPSRDGNKRPPACCCEQWPSKRPQKSREATETAEGRLAGRGPVQIGRAHV